MSSTTDRLRRGFLALLALAAVAGAFAFSFILNNNTGIPIKWPAGNVQIRLLLGDTANLEDGTSFNQTARTAALAWNATIGSIRFQTETATGNPGDHNGVNEMAFATRAFNRDFGDDVLAIATTWAIGNKRTEGDILFNTATYTWNSYRGDRRGNVIDLQRVALHELGHVLGLDHPDEDGQQVDAIMNSRIGNSDSLREDDIAGARQLYGSPSIPANDAFANARLITGTPFSIQATNTLATKEPGEPDHAGDAGGHSVWFTWTAPTGGTVALDTKGSYYDTTLAVYTGTQVANLIPIAADDDIEDGVIQASELSFIATAETSYHFAVDGFDGDTGGFRLSLTVDGVTGAAPTIINQPRSITRNVTNGAGFSVTATGSDPLTFQWFFNGNPISGATNAAYSINNVATANAGNYHCVVTNVLGSATSNTAVLTVNAPPPPSAPPSSGGGGGGGGAPSLWFVAVLAGLGLARACARRLARNK